MLNFWWLASVLIGACQAGDLLNPPPLERRGRIQGSIKMVFCFTNRFQDQAILDD